jgi:hypothetical protein
MLNKDDEGRMMNDEFRFPWRKPVRVLSKRQEFFGLHEEITGKY